MTLSAHLCLHRDGFSLDVALSAVPGEILVMLGPNGAGKSTVLALLAGLLRLDAGRITRDGEVIADPAAGVHQPPQHRHVGLVVQDYLLFPHLSALENVAFGLRARGVRRAAARAAAAGWLARMGVRQLAGRRPGQLSGGQAQRVALARALAAQPRLLLLDEPLAALDAGARPAVRADLRRHLGEYGGYTVLVTHDPLEALVIAHQIVVLEHGRVVQQGRPAELARHPRTDYVARLVGLNLIRGLAAGRTATVAADASVALAHDASGPVHVAFPPSAVTLSLRRPESSARNAWPGRIADVERHGDLVRVTVDGTVPVRADVTPLAVTELSLRPGVPVWASVKATEIRVYPA
ncbi:MAG: ABC transporter ATP-binding protein [Jiangellaceae bacterium]|nr:ABC transporter ATP-binding protein [Jiangellaceae bacterium]